MKVDIVYREIKKTEALETYLTEQVAALEHFLQENRDSHLTIRLEEDRHRQESRKPHFLVELLLKMDGTKEPIKVSKDGEDFKVAVAKAVEALDGILRKSHDKRSSHH